MGYGGQFSYPGVEGAVGYGGVGESKVILLSWGIGGMGYWGMGGWGLLLLLVVSGAHFWPKCLEAPHTHNVAGSIVRSSGT